MVKKIERDASGMTINMKRCISFSPVLILTCLLLISPVKGLYEFQLKSTNSNEYIFEKQSLSTIDQLFHQTKESLNAIDSTEVALEVFNETIDKLAVYDILNENVVNIVKLSIKNQWKYIQSNESQMCLIIGRTTGTRNNDLLTRSIVSSLSSFRIILKKISDSLHPIIYRDIDMALYLITYWATIYTVPISNIIPTAFFQCLSFGGYSLHSRESFSAQGWVTTFGLDGVKEWNGSFFGQMKWPVVWTGATIGYCGIKGFNGLLFSHWDDEIQDIVVFFIGSCILADIGYEPLF